MSCALVVSGLFLFWGRCSQRELNSLDRSCVGPRHGWVSVQLSGKPLAVPSRNGEKRDVDANESLVANGHANGAANGETHKLEDDARRTGIEHVCIADTFYFWVFFGGREEVLGWICSECWQPPKCLQDLCDYSNHGTLSEAVQCPCPHFILLFHGNPGWSW